VREGGTIATPNELRENTQRGRSLSGERLIQGPKEEKGAGDGEDKRSYQDERKDGR